MPASVLSTVVADGPLLRWLHSHDPDRNLTPELLDESATYATRVVGADVAAPGAPPPPPVASLFVPMYTRGHFVLGQLYGPMSPNSMALNLLAQAGYGKPPKPISRRFVVDLSFRDALEFIEYEWFSDGMCCISSHSVSSTGVYSGKTMLMGPAEEPANPVPLRKEDLLEGAMARSPTNREVMTIFFSQQPHPCPDCGLLKDSCNCHGPAGPLSFLPPADQPMTWLTWLSAFGASRMGIVKMTMQFSMATPTGARTGTHHVTLHQQFELGLSRPDSLGNLLLRMFMDHAGMLVSHPLTDTVVLTAEEKRDRMELENVYHNQPHPWPSPHVFSTSARQFGSSRHSDYAGPPYTSCDVPSESCPSTEGEGSSANTVVFPGHMAYQYDNAGNSQEPFSMTGSPSAAYGPTAMAVGASGGLSTSSRDTRRKAKEATKPIQCKCGKTFTHKGHYNEHYNCVHRKVKQHRCLHVGCSSRFFKKSDRNRHMRSKHDSSLVICFRCETVFPHREALDRHSREHEGNGT